MLDIDLQSWIYFFAGHPVLPWKSFSLPVLSVYIYIYIPGDCPFYATVKVFL